MRLSLIVHLANSLWQAISILGRFEGQRRKDRREQEAGADFV
jgi:hypothetical protein